MRFHHPTYGSNILKEHSEDSGSLAICESQVSAWQDVHWRSGANEEAGEFDGINLGSLSRQN